MFDSSKPILVIRTRIITSVKWSIFFVLLIFLLCSELAYILNAERSIKEAKNAPYHARSGTSLNAGQIVII